MLTSTFLAAKKPRRYVIRKPGEVDRVPPSRVSIRPSHSYVPAALPFSLDAVLRVPDAALLGSSCGV